MPPVATPDESIPTIAALFAIPVFILFAGVWLAVSCSERWNKSNSRIKRHRERRKENRKTASSTSKTPRKKSDGSTLAGSLEAEEKLGYTATQNCQVGASTRAS
jgi:hypothetical protein